jgi:hypothetical protein
MVTPLRKAHKSLTLDWIATHERAHQHRVAAGMSGEGNGKQRWIN